MEETQRCITTSSEGGSPWNCFEPHVITFTWPIWKLDEEKTHVYQIFLLPNKLYHNPENIRKYKVNKKNGKQNNPKLWRDSIMRCTATTWGRRNDNKREEEGVRPSKLLEVLQSIWGEEPFLHCQVLHCIKQASGTRKLSKLLCIWLSFSHVCVVLQLVTAHL